MSCSGGVSRITVCSIDSSWDSVTACDRKIQNPVNVDKEGESAGRFREHPKYGLTCFVAGVFSDTDRFQFVQTLVPPWQGLGLDPKVAPRVKACQKNGSRTRARKEKVLPCEHGCLEAPSMDGTGENEGR